MKTQTAEMQNPRKLSDVGIHENLTPKIEVKEVLRFLGAKDGTAPLRTVNKIKSFIAESRDIFEPKVLVSDQKILGSEQGSLRISPGIELKSPKLSKTFKDCDTVRVFVATVGDKVDTKINALVEENKVAEACILDAIASVAVEDTIETFHSTMDRKLKSKSKSATLRFSPGYCDWDIKEQKKLFDLIDASKVGVTLSENSLMSPRKSVSGVFGVGLSGKVERRKNNPCMLCGKKDCNARRESN